MKNTIILLFVFAVTGYGVQGLADDFPHGCVDCHVQEEGSDMRINTILSRIGHGRGGERTKQVPEGCARCHASDDDGSAGSLRKLVHSIHYESPDENAYLKEFGGDCRHCHSMDAPKGRPGVKSGERNWTLTIVESR
jgi:hypothetical protein